MILQLNSKPIKIFIVIFELVVVEKCNCEFTEEKKLLCFTMLLLVFMLLEILFAMYTM